MLDAVKHEIRKYVQRERRRALPQGVDYLDFDCKFGPTQDGAQVVHFATLTSHINAIAQAGGAQFYIEILAKHGVRVPRPEGTKERVTSAAAAATYLDDED